MDGLGQTRVCNKIDNDNYMFVKIGRYMQRALIDTGAHYSCVSMSFMKRLHLLPKMIKGPNQKRYYVAAHLNFANSTWSKQMLLGFSAGFCFFCF